MSRVCHVTHTNEWYHAYGWVMCHVWLIMSHTQLGHVRGMWHMHMRLSQYGIHVTPPFAWILYTYIYIYSCISISHHYLSEYYNIIDTSINDPETNIRLAWEAVTLGNKLLVGLCRCFEPSCTCATQQMAEILNSLKTSQAQIYCRE